MTPDQKPKQSNLATARLLLAAVILISSSTVLGVAGYLGMNKPVSKNTVEPSVIVTETSKITADKDLTVESLKNAEYTFGSSGEKYRLIDGSYFKENPERAFGMGKHIGIFDGNIVLDDLNNDGKKDAAVILDYIGGGTGHFYELAIVINKNGEPLQIASEDLGDRSVINSLKIKDGKIIVDMIVHGQDDGMCCPTDRKIFEYELQNDKLMKTGDYNYDETVQSDVAGWKTYRNNKYGFSIDYPENWRGHTNNFAGEPNMIFCSPDFFVEKNNGWLSWTDNSDKSGCASERRVWAEDGQVNLIMVEGVGEVTRDEFNQKWKEKIAKEISSIFLFVRKYQGSKKELSIYLGENAEGYWYLEKTGTDKNNDKIFNQFLSTFKFIEKDSSFSCGTSIVSDIDGNTYTTVQIGSQCWLKENLKVTRNPEGKPITRYCYDNDPKICETDGGLYDWNTAMNNSVVEGSQGICPNGWHIPKDSEWYILESGLAEKDCLNFRSGSRSEWSCVPAGLKLKNGGSGNFDALLVGYRNNNGKFVLQDKSTYFWSSLNGKDDSYALARGLALSDYSINRSASDKSMGLSIRCLKD